ncbi:uncharacterized protein [Chironomus tepperi]|uniref:uncharacterized protein isoform X2 n=1 Tax=Chironomus tepperi TaxID=113505 RepID=UPI00391FBE7E
MLTFGIICALVATTSAGYSSSSAGGYSSAGAAPYVPVVTPFDIQQYIAQLNAFQANPSTRSLTTGYAGEGAKVQSYASLSPSKRSQDRRNNKNNKNNNLWYQNLAQQAAIQNSVAANYNAIRDQALYGNRFGYGGYGAGGGGYAGSGGFAGAGVGSYGGVGGGSTYGGTYNSPGYATPVVNRFGGGGSYSGGGGNYAASGGSVGGGHQSGFAHVSPPRLDSRFGDEGIVSHSVGQPGVVGVSSFSSSSDINGYKQRESGTSVNNNGKVTTYYNRNK